MSAPEIEIDFFIVSRSGALIMFVRTGNRSWGFHRQDPLPPELAARAHYY
jgi:hypothetical protein